MRTIPLGILGICSSLFKCCYLKNGKRFGNFLFHLWNLHQILNILGKKMIVIVDVFWKLQTVKNLLKPLSRNHRFRTSFNSQRVPTLAKSASGHFYHIFWSLWWKITWIISPLLNFQILEVFVNTLTDDDYYTFGDSEDLQFPIQMQLS